LDRQCDYVANHLQVLAIALAVLTAEQVMNGLGEHSSKLDPRELDTVLKVSSVLLRHPSVYSVLSDHTHMGPSALSLAIFK
jgi:ABC-type uncharacterized transport system ATPase component